MTSWKTQVMPPSPVLRFWQLTNSIQSEGPNELCDGVWTAEQASSPTQPLSCEIQPFTCELNSFLDKHLQASSCKYIRISIIFSTWGAILYFLPWEKWSTSQKICRKKGTKPIKWQLIFCAYNTTNTLLTEKSTQYWPNLLGHIALWWL